jgi:hypothetical protein
MCCRSLLNTVDATINRISQLNSPIMTIKTIIRMGMIVGLITQLSACLMNSVRRLDHGGVPQVDTSVIVYGVRLDTAWSAPQMMFGVDAYDIEKQAIKGDCWHLDRAQVSVSGVPDAMQYFAFEVPAGHYVFGAWSTVALTTQERVFYAPKSETVFLGNFIYTANQKIEIQRELVTTKPEILAALPKTNPTISLAPAQATSQVKLFMCTP